MIIKKKPPRISETKSRITYESREKWGLKPSQTLPLRGACLVPCTGHTSLCHSATDASDTFQRRRVQFLELCTVVFLNCIQLSIFRGVGQSYFTFVALFFTEAQILDSGDQCQTSKTERCLEIWQLCTATQTQYTGVVCRKILEKNIFRDSANSTWLWRLSPALLFLPLKERLLIQVISQPETRELFIDRSR